MIWKELTCTLSRRERFTTALVLGIEGLLIAVCYTFPAVMGVVGYEAAHLAYLWVFLGLAVLFTVTASATVIGSERESRAWAVLLMTPLTDAEILFGKFLGVLRRCGLVWLSLLVYVAAFAWVEFFRPLVIVHTMIIIVSALLFACGTGFYFGSRCRRTVEAVTANLVLVGVLWCILPLIVQAATFAVDADWDAGRLFILLTGPFGQAFAMMRTTLETSAETRWWWSSGFRLDASGMALLMAASMAVYVLVSVGFTWRAVRGFRRRIF
jgi:ABC-type transport system involved in multi-copper enzyme maturation permease subunit